MVNVKRTLLIVPLAIAGASFCIATAQGKKPDNPGGGGGGNAGGGDETQYSVIELPIENPSWALISDPTPSGVVTIALDAPDEGYGSGAFVKVDSTSGAVLDHGFLPEPEFIDPDGVPHKNGWSDTNDVNAAGVIAGYSSTFHPNFGPGPSRATIWTDSGSSYSMTPLPLPVGAVETRAFGINNQGTVVGSAITSTGNNSAILWDAHSLVPVDLNTVATAALGWELKSADDINDDGLIVGQGTLNNVERSFLLNLTSGDILPVPIVDLAVDSRAHRVNSTGRVVGWAWDGDGNAGGLDPDFATAFSWDGPGADPVALPSVTDNTSLAVGLNDINAVVGYSLIPTDDALEIHSVGTLWELDPDGTPQAIDLGLEIPSKPDYTLGHATDVNNDGWIVNLSRKSFKGKYSWPAVLLVPKASLALSTFPVPEPSTYVLLTIGALGALSRTRRLYVA